MNVRNKPSKHLFSLDFEALANMKFILYHFFLNVPEFGGYSFCKDFDELNVIKLQ